MTFREEADTLYSSLKWDYFLKIFLILMNRTKSNGVPILYKSLTVKCYVGLTSQSFTAVAG